MPYRLTAIVLMLTGGDYLLWNWSLSANHDTFALIAGLSLPLLLLCLLWVLVQAALRLVVRSAEARRATNSDPEFYRYGQKSLGLSASTTRGAAERHSSSDKLAA